MQAHRETGGAAYTPEQRYRMIAEAAYFRAQSRGFCGDPVDDWLAAEADVDHQLLGDDFAGLSAKQRFQRTLETQLRELDRLLDELKLQTNLGKAELRDEFERQLGTLSEKRNAAQAKLQELGRRSEDAWEDLKSGLEKARDEVRSAFHQIVDRFR